MNRIIFIAIVLSSCAGESLQDDSIQDTKQNIFECSDDFQKVFSEVLEKNDEYLVDSIAIIDQSFPEGFYTQEELNDYLFIRFYNKITEFSAAIDTANKKPFHEIHFIYKHEDYFYIDNAWSIQCNLNFLNNCGVNIYTATTNACHQTKNLFDVRMIKKWNNKDSQSELKNLEFMKNNIIINKDTLLYYHHGYEVFRKEDSTLLFERIALSNNNMVLYDVSRKETYYFEID